MAQVPASRRRMVGIRPASTAQSFATLVGAVFLITGIVGFVPGFTTNVDDITFAGNDSGAELFDVFQVSVLHNLIHLAFGVLGLWAARTVAASRLYLVGGGLVYLAIALYGALIDKGSDANFVPMDTADDWLHLGLGVGMVLLGVLAGARLGDLTDRRSRRGRRSRRLRRT
jgi:hypothetical protein